MSGVRPWGAAYFRQAKGAPFYSLGVHLDLHTPRLDLHLPHSVLTVGRIRWWPGGFVMPRDRAMEPGRWNGHSDDCDHTEARP